MEKILFFVFATLAVLSALNIILQRNPLYSAVSLIGTLASVSALFVMLHAPFIGALQIIVYAGAIMVLFVFVIMLLNEPKDVPHIDKQRGLRFLAIPFAGLLLTEGWFIVTKVPKIAPPVIDNSDRAFGTTFNIGVGMFSDYLLPFEVTSILLLMAVVGAMVLARRDGD